MTATEHVILVDKDDKETGIAEKIEAHKQNLCHRAFSIFIFRKQPELELLLQKRADNKYHSAGLWTNTCCSHPRPGESILQSGKRRLQEEMGISAHLISLGWFHYIAPFENGLTENEVDHVLVGTLEQEEFIPNPNEVKDYKWISLPDLTKEIMQHPQDFTPWLSLALVKIQENIAVI